MGTADGDQLVNEPRPPTEDDATEVRCRDLVAYIEKSESRNSWWLMIDDSQHEVVFDMVEAKALRDWLNKVLL